MGRRRRGVPDRGRVPADRRAPARLALAARLLLEYDGSGFAGWARQPGARTVEEELGRALATVRQAEVKLTVAGRTDAGVHARGQVASHEGEPVSRGRLNGLLPPDLRVLESTAAPDGFDARRDARARTYRYRVFPSRVAPVLERGRVLHWTYGWDADALSACAALLPGTHDFTAFTPAGGYHQRFTRDVMRAEWADEPGGVHAFWIEADSFMRRMVRTLVGTMLDVSVGRMTFEAFAALLEGHPRAAAGETAPAHGLYLESVRYDGADSIS